LNTKEIAQLMGLKSEGVLPHLRILEKEGKIKRMIENSSRSHIWKLNP